MDQNSVVHRNENIFIQKLDSGSHSKKYFLEIPNHKSFEINESLFRFIELIDGQSTIGEITERYNALTGKRYMPQEVIRLIEEQLVPRGIIQNESHIGSPMKTKKTSYLSFALPLLSKEKISLITRSLAHLYRPIIALPALLLFAMVNYLYYSVYMSPRLITLDYFLGHGIIFIYILFNLSLILHELGHASALRYFGEEHGSIGMGIYIFMLVMYTDVSRAWRLKRHQRIIVNLGGIYFEMYVLLLTFALYLIFRLPVLLMIFFIIEIKLFFNLIPFFRMDGYWITSDLLGVTNLRNKSQEMMAYLLKSVFGKRRPPDALQQYSARIRFLIALYAVSSQLFFIYVGIRISIYAWFLAVRFRSEFIQPLSVLASFQNLSSLIVPILYLSGKISFIVFSAFYVYRLINNGVKIIKRSLNYG